MDPEWAFNTLPPTRPHLLILLKKYANWEPDNQIYEFMGSILLQSTSICVCVHARVHVCMFLYTYEGVHVCVSVWTEARGRVRVPLYCFLLPYTYTFIFCVVYVCAKGQLDGASSLL